MVYTHIRVKMQSDGKDVVAAAQGALVESRPSRWAQCEARFGVVALSCTWIVESGPC